MCTCRQILSPDFVAVFCGAHSPWTYVPQLLFDCRVPKKRAILPLKSFGIRVREIREQIGLSQEELAILAGLDRSYLGGVERGERNISLINIYRIAKALDVPASQLLQSRSQ